MILVSWPTANVRSSQVIIFKVIVLDCIFLCIFYYCIVVCHTVACLLLWIFMEQNGNKPLAFLVILITHLAFVLHVLRYFCKLSRKYSINSVKAWGVFLSIKKLKLKPWIQVELEVMKQTEIRLNWNWKMIMIMICGVLFRFNLSGITNWTFLLLYTNLLFWHNTFLDGDPWPIYIHFRDTGSRRHLLMP